MSSIRSVTGIRGTYGNSCYRPGMRLVLRYPVTCLTIMKLLSSTKRLRANVSGRVLKKQKRLWFTIWLLPLRAVGLDRSMENLLNADPEKYGYMAILNRLQRFIAKRRYARKTAIQWAARYTKVGILRSSQMYTRRNSRNVCYTSAVAPTT